MHLSNGNWKPIHTGLNTIGAFNACFWLCEKCLKDLADLPTNVHTKYRGGDVVSGSCTGCGKPIVWAEEVMLTVQIG